MAKFDSTGAQMMADRNAAPYSDYVPITPSDEALEDGPCRGILASEDGVLNLTNPDGTERENVTVLRGINPFVATIIDAPTTGDAPASVMALY
jgi:hypothetical protein